MKNIGEFYFKETKIVSYFRILSLILIIIGSAILLFGYGFGMIGIPIIIFGIIIFFISSSKIIGDKEYDQYLNEKTKEVTIEDIDFEFIKSWEFSAFSVGNHAKKGKDSIIRTDCFTTTKILMNKTQIKLIQHTISVAEEVRHCILIFKKNEATLNTFTQTCGNNQQFKLNYVEIIVNGQQAASFPVPPNNYDVEEMIHYLSTAN